MPAAPAQKEKRHACIINLPDWRRITAPQKKMFSRSIRQTGNEPFAIVPISASNVKFPPPPNQMVPFPPPIRTIRVPYPCAPLVRHGIVRNSRFPLCGLAVGKMRTTCFEPYQAYWLELFFDNRKCNKIRLANRLTTRSRFGDAAHGQPVHKSLREKKGNSSQVCYIYNRTLPQEGAKPNNKTKEELLWNIIPQLALM